ncbi:MAG: CPBP family intramembrane metalloprotease [Anaerolineaceae bacterium]|nr:CPBP family intramembrane metalloprotease [Anaerolineaceae bacterium]
MRLLAPHNRLFTLAQSGKRLPHLIVAIILSVLFIVAAQLIGGPIAVILVLLTSLATGQFTPTELQQGLSSGDPAVIMGYLFPNTGLEQAIFLICFFGPVFLILWAWLALFEKRPLWTIGLERPAAWQKYLRGALVGLVMFMAAVGISAAAGYIAVEPGGSSPTGIWALGGVIIVLAGWMVQGAAEEALTRGWLLPVIGARYRPWLGILASALLFALLHSLNPNLSPIAMLNLALFGLFTALYALAEQSLWGVFSIHSVWNWAQGNLFGFEVSGQPAPGGTLFNLMEIGPDWLTGGPFGPEGGLAVTVVLVIGCAVVWVIGSRR